MVHTAFPDFSASFNPLGSAETPLEIADRIQVLTPDSREPFFESFSMAFITALAAAHRRSGRRGRSRASMRSPAHDSICWPCWTTISRQSGCHRPGVGVEHRIAEYEKRGVKNHTADALLNFARRRPSDFDKLISTLVPTFHGVVGDQLDRLL